MDAATQIVRFPRDLVRKAMAAAPRSFTMAARNPAFDLALEEGTSYYTTDGCGVAAIDPDTGLERPSRKEDVARMARVADYLPSIGFMWATVSAQDMGRTSQLHEMDAAYNNTVKHFQGMVMGDEAARFAVEMATVIAGSREALRARPAFSNLICSIAPLAQDHAGLESALVMAEAGIPVGFLSMPTLGTTAPSTSAGALVVGDAEVISGIVLLQLAYPGAPVFHSIMKAWADPRTGNYVGYSLDGRIRYAPVEMAHRWGVPSMAACFGTDSASAGTWLAAADVALDPLLGGLSGAELVTGMGLDRTYTLMYPEGIFLDNELYERARYALMADEGRRRDAGAGRHRGRGPGRALPGGGAHPQAHEDVAQARPRARPGQRPLPRPDRGGPREGGLGAGEPPPGAAGGGEAGGAHADPRGRPGRIG